LYLDIASIKNPSKGMKKFLILFLDAYSGCVFSRFARHQNDHEILGMYVPKGLADQGIEVRAIHCDNTGENKTLESARKRVRFE
jgi:hypothetical protein